MCKHLHIKIKGKVQGVWFRKYTLEKANRLNLLGFVQNKTDGSVYVEVEGNNTVLKDFVSWLHKGSPLSKVDSVEILEEQNCKGFEKFEIKRL